MWDYSTKGVRVRLIEINIKKKNVDIPIIFNGYT